MPWCRCSISGSDEVRLTADEVCRFAVRGILTAMDAKRELIEPHPGDKRFIRRDDKGRIDESVDVGRSLAQDVRQHAKTTAKPGQGDKGDRPARKKG
jgi:hypothetical protein